MDLISAAEMVAHGLISNPDAIVEIRESTGDPHSGPGGRSYRVALASGLAFEVLPERGFDIGSLWYRGWPIAWRSSIPAAGPDSDPSRGGWVGRFTGGMLATCGLDNIGKPREGHGQHGSHHHTRAVDVGVRRTDAPGVILHATIANSAVFGRQVFLYREIEANADQPALTVRDTIVNNGTTREPISLLYHINFGAPFLVPGTRVDANAERRTARDDDTDWHSFPAPIDTVGETVWEHTDFADERALTTVYSPALATRAEIAWNAAVLPRCFQWIYPSRRGWALGIEPANAPLFGPDRDTSDAGATWLEPGGRIESGFTLTFRTEAPG
ncbi:DUF4432 family protein [Actinoplanes flavus]|uniref:DUF4432 family protein n=1 Tax=Actinoplanes flavus TaxID=2820290 RepID=A0ABS3UJ84_9ACTN|nr:DUF4432 family protein [Actinoplanes flavus]MBO3738849.1 DUF4432 family protein [Actinoplanes flavus]